MPALEQIQLNLWRDLSKPFDLIAPPPTPGATSSRRPTLTEPASPQASTSTDEAGGGTFAKPDDRLTQQEYHEREEIYRLRKDQLKKEVSVIGIGYRNLGLLIKVVN